MEINQQSSLYDCLFNGGIHTSWLEALEPHKESIERIFNLISKKETSHGEFYPLKKDVFNFLKITPLDKVSVVIWGQDPYPTLLKDGTPRAQGYSFGVHKDDVVPLSLQNVFKEIKSDFPMFEIPDNGDLRYLGERGVLFMNQALTYCPKEPKLYLKMWNRFTYIIINIINEKIENCIHLLWGKQCEVLAEHIRSREIFQTSHPSPFSVRRGFIGCKHFLKVNITLQKQGKKQINWNSDEDLKETYLENLNS